MKTFLFQIHKNECKIDHALGETDCPTQYPNINVFQDSAHNYHIFDSLNQTADQALVIPRDYLKDFVFGLLSYVRHELELKQDTTKF